MTSSAPPTLLAMDILLPLLFMIAPGFVFLLGHHGAVPRNPCAAPRNPMAPRVEVPGDKTKTQKC